MSWQIGLFIYNNYIEHNLEKELEMISPIVLAEMSTKKLIEFKRAIAVEYLKIKNDFQYVEDLPTDIAAELKMLRDDMYQITQVIETNSTQPAYA